MNISPRLLPLALSFASWQRVSPPPPYNAESAADRAIAGLAPGVVARSARLGPAMARRPAHNAVARERLFAALTAAIGPGITIRRHLAQRHGLLTARALAASMPHGATPGTAPGISVDLLFALAGKRIDARTLARPLVASHHACVRFVERSGHREPAALHAAVLEAASHAEAVLVAYLDGGLGHRLRGGMASILLPAGDGAFLGHLRLLPTPEGGAPVPAIEAATWVHLCMLDTPQIEARDVLLAGLPPDVLVRALPEAWAQLQVSVSGDRRVLAGLRTVPLNATTPVAERLALACGPAMAAARVGLGLACADTLAAELEASR